MTALQVPLTQAPLTVAAPGEIKPSLFRSVDVAQAAGMKRAVDIFFGGPQPLEVEQKKQSESKTREWPKWVVTGGAALALAGGFTWIATQVFRGRVFNVDTLPLIGTGLYLGFIGLAVVCAGVVLLKPAAAWAFNPIAPPLPVRPTVEENPGLKAIRDQINHLSRYAEGRFGARLANSTRALLQGIGRRAWNDNHDIPIKEPVTADGKVHEICAAVVHLVAVDLTPPFISIRQWGLDVRTGTVCEEWAIRHPISELISVSRRTKTAVDQHAWTRADELLRQIETEKKSRKPLTEAQQKKVAGWELELKQLEFERSSGIVFELTFTGGDKIELQVSDAEVAQNSKRIAHPIGGQNNLLAAKAMWNAIEKARLDAEHRILLHRNELSQSAAGTHASIGNVDKGITGVQTELREYQAAVVSGLGSVRAVTVVATALRGQFGGLPPSPPTLAPVNGHGTAGDAAP
jgi:hypothetical protein